MAKRLCFPKVDASVSECAEVADFHGNVIVVSVFAVLHFLSVIFLVLLVKPPMYGEEMFISFNFGYFETVLSSLVTSYPTECYLKTQFNFLTLKGKKACVCV